MSGENVQREKERGKMYKEVASHCFCLKDLSGLVVQLEGRSNQCIPELVGIYEGDGFRFQNGCT